MASKKLLAQVVEGYCCPKCRNHTCHTEQVALTGGGAAQLTSVLGLGNGRYLVVTCTLCGFSEMYNLRVLSKYAEEAPVSKDAAPSTSRKLPRMADDE